MDMGYGRDDRDPRERSRFFDEQRERSRFDEQRERASRGGQGSGERGFFERAGDEISSWFGDDEAERRREMDERSGSSWRGDTRSQGRDDYRDQGRSRFFGSDDRGQRFRDEAPRRPYSGRPAERDERSRESARGTFGGRSDMDRDRGYRPMTGDYGRSSSDRFERDAPDYGRAGAAVASGVAAAHDRHYSEWRQRQIDEIDRDYDEYRREHQSKFESDFSNWRSARQSKRQMLGQIREHMEVVGSDDQAVGKVDKVRGDRVILTKSDSPDGQHHSVNCAMIDRVEGDKVFLDRKADEARAMFGNEQRDRALYERDDKREPGAHMLNRSFSGTY
jgi:hypothetical protein